MEHRVKKDGARITFNFSGERFFEAMAWLKPENQQGSTEGMN